MKQTDRESRTRWIKLTAFFGVLAVLCVIGIFLPRPTESEIEKRKLTEFPAFTWESFWSGKWFSGIDTWYADTYPLRELLIGGNKVVQSLYGIRSDVIVGGENQGEEIPDIEGGQGELPTLPKDDPENKTDDPQQDNNTELPRDGNVSADGEMISGIFVSGNVGYGLYYFQQENSDWYAAILNEMDKRLAGKAQLYSLVAPINGGVLLSDSLQKELHISDQREAIRYIYSRMAADINGVEVFDALREHVDEYIYFHTDHHWTALGAYYAYTQYAKAAGLTPHMLDQFEQVEFPNFLGTYYSVSGITSLGANPDTVIAYKPMGTNKMKMTMADGTTYDWFVVNDVSGYGSSMKYGAFAGGDQPYSVVENPEITDGSACLVIKDSYGNALIPYLVDHYQYLYWIDFRYYKGSIYDLVAEKNIKDVLVLQQIYNTGDSGALKKLQAAVQANERALAEAMAGDREQKLQLIEDCNAQIAALREQQAAQAAAQERSRHADRADDLERRGQEQRAGSLDGDHGHELFLIFAVECAAAVLRRERGNGRGAVVKAADGVQQLCAGAGVAHSRAAGALVDGGGLDARLIEQVGFEQVGLLERHAVLVHPDTQPAAALVLNECFHDELPPFNQGKMEKEGHFVPLFDCFGADYASAGAASAAISSAISSAQSSISAAAASASAARCSLMSFAACRMSSAFSRTVSTVFITQSFIRRTAAAAWV